MTEFKHKGVTYVVMPEITWDTGCTCCAAYNDRALCRTFNDYFDCDEPKVVFVMKGAGEAAYVATVLIGETDD